MKRLIICIFVFATALNSWSTAQRGDVIFIYGEQWELLGDPIAEDSDLFHRVRGVLPKERATSSNNWRGYVAYWSVRNDIIYLDSIKVPLFSFETGQECEQLIPEDDIRSVFNEFYIDNEIIATWFSGNIRVGKGNIVRYEHIGYDRNVEHEQILTVKDGNIVNRVSYHNGIVVDGFSFKNLDSPNWQELIKEKIPFPVDNYPELAGKKIKFSVTQVQIDSIGNLIDCEVSTNAKNKVLKKRLPQEMKTVLRNIKPWKVWHFNGVYKPDIDHCNFSISF